MGGEPELSLDHIHPSSTAREQARLFRLTKQPFYPGRLVVLVGGQWTPEPIDDEAFVAGPEGKYPTTMIALWGRVSENAPGLVAVEDGYLPVICADHDRPMLDHARLDAWIVRVDALRMILGNTVEALGGRVPIPQDQFAAAVLEIAEVVRHSSSEILTSTSLLPAARRAIAKLVNARFPTISLLERAALMVVVSVTNQGSESIQPRPPERRPGDWFSDATNGLLTPETLRKAAARKGLKDSVKQGNLWHHSIDEVALHHPEHATKLRKFSADESN